ncbi:MAG: response regulator [Phycisphaerae bacterium]
MAFTILIVDDSATTRAVIKRSIEMAQVETENILQAANGRDALDVLDDIAVDLVFLDLNMPEMNGMTFAAEVKNRPELARTPIVVVSSESMDSRVQQLRDLGVRGYIKKPFTPENIRSVINEILGVVHA